MEHDPLCPQSKAKKSECICRLLNDAREEGETLGRIATIDELSWSCGDCGNTYGPDVDECPNALLDEMAMHRLARGMS